MVFKPNPNTVCYETLHPSDSKFQDDDSQYQAKNKGKLGTVEGFGKELAMMEKNLEQVTLTLAQATHSFMTTSLH